jgi:hypothetical protein
VTGRDDILHEYAASQSATQSVSRDGYAARVSVGVITATGGFGTISHAAR